MKKQILSSALLLLLALVMIFSFAACKKDATTTEQPQTDNTQTTADGTVSKTGLWADATYDKDTTLGTGAKTLTVKVEADGQSITFTIKTDAQTVAAAMLEHDLIVGETASWGGTLYNIVNGMAVRYENGGYYWGFFKGGEYMNTGLDDTTFADGDAYELVKTK